MLVLFLMILIDQSVLFPVSLGVHGLSDMKLSVYGPSGNVIKFSFASLAKRFIKKKGDLKNFVHDCNVEFCS